VYIADNEDLESALAPYWQAREIALDIETAHNRNGGVRGSGGSIRTIQLGIGHPYRAQELVIDMHHVDEEPLVRLLSRRDVTWVIHSADFERSWLFYQYGVDLRKVYDTCVAWRTLWKHRQSKRHGGAYYHSHTNDLGSLAKEILGLELPKDCQTSHWGAASLTLRQVQYAAADVRVLIQLLSKTRERVRAEGLDGPTLWQAMGRSRKNLLARHSPAEWAAMDDSAILTLALCEACSESELDLVWNSRKTLSLYYQNRRALKELYQSLKHNAKWSTRIYNAA
jgi:ribonuclease D